MKEPINIHQLLDESIRLELLVSDLYHFYHTSFNEHKDFWWTMTLEEKNHASILKSSRVFLDLKKLPESAVYDNIEATRGMCESVAAFLEKCKDGSVDMKKAYEFALSLEEAAAEFHFQDMLTSDSSEKVINIFQKLGKDDTGHAARIEKLMKDNGLLPPS